MSASRPRLRFAALLAVLLLTLVSGGLLTNQPAAGQGTEITVLSNLRENDNTGEGTGSILQGRMYGFTAGSDLQLSSIEISIDQATGSQTAPTMTLHEGATVDASNNATPGTKVADFTTPTLDTVSVHTDVVVSYTPTTTMVNLTAGTTYWLVFTGGSIALNTRTHASGTETAQDGWSISSSNYARFFSATGPWASQSGGNIVVFRVKGTVVDTTAPTPLHGTISATAITVTFDEALDSTSLPALSAFSIHATEFSRTDADPRAPRGTLSISGATLTITGENYAPGYAAFSGDHSLTYTEPAAAESGLRDAAENRVGDFTIQLANLVNLLVGNTDLALKDAGGLSSNSYNLAQEFTTGANTHGYKLFGVELRLKTGTDTDGFFLVIERADTEVEVARLGGPAQLEANTTRDYLFIAEPGVILDASTSYRLRQNTADDIEWVQAETTGTGEMSGSQTGWSIKNTASARVIGSPGAYPDAPSGGPFLLRVLGVTPTGTTAPSPVSAEAAIDAFTPYGAVFLRFGDDLFQTLSNDSATDFTLTVTREGGLEQTIVDLEHGWHSNTRYEVAVLNEADRLRNTDTNIRISYTPTSPNGLRLTGANFVDVAGFTDFSVTRNVIGPVVQNIDQTTGTQHAFAGGLAQSFTTGPNPTGYKFGGVTLRFSGHSSVTFGTFVTLQLREDTPTGTLVGTEFSAGATTASSELITASTSPTLDLERNKTYWIVATATNTNIGWFGTASDEEDEESFRGFTMGDVFQIKENATSEFADDASGESLQMQVLGRAKDFDASLNSPASGSNLILVPAGARVPAVLSLWDTEHDTKFDDTDGHADYELHALYNWQRLAADGATVVQDMVGTEPTYTLTADDVGHRIRLIFNFIDDVGYEEELTSSPTDVVLGAATCAAPSYRTGETQIWTGNLTLAHINVVGLGNPISGFIDGTLSGGHPIGGGFGVITILGQDFFGALDTPSISAVGSGYTISFIGVNHQIGGLLSMASLGRLHFQTSTAMTDAERAPLALWVCDQAFPFHDSAAESTTATRARHWDDAGLDWEDLAERTLYISKDSSAPTVVSASVETTELSIEFSEEIDADALPAASTFTVERTPAGGTEATVTVNSVAASGSTVTLTLASAIVESDTDVKVTYTKPDTGNTLADPFGNEVATFTDQAVTTGPPVPPELDTANPPSIPERGTQLNLRFSEALKETPLPQASAFTVRVTPNGGTAGTVALRDTIPIAVSDTTILLYPDRPIAHDDVVTVSYTKPSSGNVVEDLAGSDLESFAAVAVTNNSTIPRITLEAVYDEASPVLANPRFRVTRSNVSDQDLFVSLRVAQGTDFVTDPDLSFGATIGANQTTATTEFDTSFGAASGTLTVKLASSDSFIPDLTSGGEASVEMRMPTNNATRYLEVSFKDPTYEVEEGDQINTILQAVSEPGLVQPRESFDVSVMTRINTAILILDYQHISREVRFAHNSPDWTTRDGRQVLEVPLRVRTVETGEAGGEPPVVENPERFSIQLDIAPGEPFQVAVSSDRAWITIIDDDPFEIEEVNVADGDLADGNSIRLTVLLNANAVVTGTPQFDVELGGETVTLDYASITGSQILFRRDIEAGENDADGISWAANSLRLNGGAIKLSGGDAALRRDLDLTHPAGAPDPPVRVDTKPIPRSGINLGVTLRLMFSENLTESDPPASAFTVAIGSAAGVSPAMVRVEGDTAILTLQQPPGPADAVSVSYARPATNPLRDAGGKQADNFSDFPVMSRANNDAPTDANQRVTIDEDTTRSFVAGDFSYNDPDGDPLAWFTIETLPDKGRLLLDDAAVNAGDRITGSRLANGALKFEPAANEHGTPYTSFTFKVSDGAADSPAYTMTIDVTPVNDPAVGQPEISGTPRIGETLTGTAGTIVDPDGVPAPSTFRFNWQRMTPSGEGVIADRIGTGGSYTVGEDDVGRRLRLVVGFTDGDGNAEEVTSEAWPADRTIASEDTPLEPRVLVSTIGQTSSGTRVARSVQLGIAQRFTTGPNNGGYNVSSVELRLHQGDYDPQGEDLPSPPRVRLFDEDARLLATFSRTDRLAPDATDNYEFTPDRFVLLSPDTDYWLVPTTDEYGVQALVTTEDAEDGSSAEGWQVDDGSEYWSASSMALLRTEADDLLRSNDVLLLRINGTFSGNIAPVAADGSVQAQESTDYAFAPGDFGYSDPDGNPLMGITLASVPSTGQLELNGAVLRTGGRVTRAQMEAGEFVYAPPRDRHGDNLASFRYRVSDGDAESDNTGTMTINVRSSSEEVTFISNLGLGSGDIMLLSSESTNIAVRFKTGSHEPGYLLSEVVIRLTASCSAESGSSLRAEANGRPGEKIADLSGTFTNGGQTPLTPPQPVLLEADTSYFVLVAYTIPESAPNAFCTLHRADLASHPGAESGWSLDYRTLSREAPPGWTESNPLEIALAGTFLEPLPAVSAADLTVDEDAGQAQISLTIDPSPKQAISIPWRTQALSATDGADFTGEDDGTLTIAADATSATIVIPIIDDILDEELPDESFAVILSTSDDRSYLLRRAPGQPDEFPLGWVRVDIRDNDGGNDVSSDSGRSPGSGDVAALSEPTNLFASAGVGEVTLSWGPPQSTGGALGIRYQYRHAQGSSIPATTPWQSVGVRTVTITDLTAGRQYTFQVRALSASPAAQGPPAETRATPLAEPDTTPPAEPTPTISGDQLTLTFNEPIDPASVPQPGDFDVIVDGAPATVTGVAISASDVILTLGAAVESGETVTVDYTPGAAPLQDGSANPVAAFGALPVRHGSPPGSGSPTGGGGFAGGGGGGGGSSGPTPSTVDFEWTVKEDIESLDPEHGAPTGMWSDGETLWLLENGSGADDAVYAYDLDTGERAEEREFALDERNRAPRGVWSDRETIWISDSGRDRLFAHDLGSGERLPERDIELVRENRDARGIWSGGGTMWVLDGGRDGLFAYDLETGALLAEYALHAANSDPHGLWSDGVTLWVSNHEPKRLFAYRLPAVPDEPPEEPLPLEREDDLDFTTLSAASNNSPRGVWSDGSVMYVADELDGRVYSYNMPDAIDARLASLSLAGVDIGEFDPGRRVYEGVIAGGVTETTVEAAAVQRRTQVVIDPPDADGDSTNGHQVALAGVAEITVTVTSADRSRTRVYRVDLGSDEPDEPWPHCLRGDVAEGFSLVVYEGGAVEDLAACAESRNVAALYALHEGVYVPLIPGAPGFVNEAFRELYPEGVPALTALVAASGGPPGADPVGELGAPRSWPRCLRGEVAEGFSLVVYEGGAVEDLASCAESLAVTALYALEDGEWVSYIPGAPDSVNEPFRELFAGGLPPVTPLVASSDGPPAAGSDGDGAEGN